MTPPRARRLVTRGAALATGAALVITLVGSVGAGAARATSTRAGRLVTQSIATSAAASSVTINGTIVNGKNRTTLHVTDVKGGNGYGVVTVDGQTVRIVQIGSVNYLKAGTTYWGRVFGSKSALPVSLYADKWVKSSAPDFAKFVDSSLVLGQYQTPLARWTLAGRTKVHGQPVTVVKGTQGGMSGTFLIAAKGPPYLMAVHPPRGQGSVTFSNWNKPITVRPPARWVAFNSGSSGSGTGASTSGSSQ